MRKIVTLAGVLLAASVAAAETIDAEHATLGWQAENAPLIALARHSGVEPMPGDSVVATFEVLETLRGDVSVGAEVGVVHHDGGHGTPWSEGGEHLVFLRPDDEGRYLPVSGSLGMRWIPEKGPERRFAGIVEEHLSTLNDDGSVRDAERLRELLVTWIGDADPGIVWSAAIDLRRHVELHDGLGVSQRRAILDAYRRHPIGKASKRALAHAVAVAGAPGSTAALLDTLALSGARPLCGDVAEALAALGSNDVVGETLARFEGATAELRGHLLVVLGAVGDAAGAAEARRRLSDTSVSVRVQAAHALGLIARAVRAADPEDRVEGRAELVAMLATAPSRNAQKAATWALAQLDTPEAYAQLRRIAEDDPRDDVRRFAERYLRRPRVALILR